jgi:hypothetical protein
MVPNRYEYDLDRLRHGYGWQSYLIGTRLGSSPGPNLGHHQGHEQQSREDQENHLYHQPSAILSGMSLH